MAQVSFGGADIFRLLYFINSKVPSGNPAFWGFRYRFFPFSSELRFRFFRALPALTSPLYFAKFAFSEMLPTSNTIPHAPLFCQGPFLSRASPREQHAAPMGSAQSRRQPQKPHNHPKSSGSGKPTRAESAAATPHAARSVVTCRATRPAGAHPPPARGRERTSRGRPQATRMQQPTKAPATTKKLLTTTAKCAIV